MNPVSVTLYGYSLLSLLQNRKSKDVSESPLSPRNVSKYIEGRADYLLEQRDLVRNLNYSDFLQIIDTRFWYEKVSQVGTELFIATCLLTLKNISSVEIRLNGVMIDWSIGDLLSKHPMFTIKPAVIQPGETADIVLCSNQFEYLYEDEKPIIVGKGKRFNLDGKEVSKEEYINLNEFVAWKDTYYYESVDSIVTLDTGLFVYLTTGELAYRELPQYYCKIQLNAEMFKLDELMQYTGYSYKTGRNIFNQLRLWKAKGYNGKPFKVFESDSVTWKEYEKALEQYSHIEDDYKNVDE